MLLHEFYNYKYDGNEDIMSNIIHEQNLAHKLIELDQAIDKNMVITKILTILPEQYTYFSSAWDSVSEVLKTIENLCRRLQLEESNIRNREKQCGDTARTNW
jgi:predicted choloylglycine hydrolase